MQRGRERQRETEEESHKKIAASQSLNGSTSSFSLVAEGSITRIKSAKYGERLVLHFTFSPVLLCVLSFSASLHETNLKSQLAGTHPFLRFTFYILHFPCLPLPFSAPLHLCVKKSE